MHLWGWGGGEWEGSAKLLGAGPGWGKNNELIDLPLRLLGRERGTGAVRQAWGRGKGQDLPSTTWKSSALISQR